MDDLITFYTALCIVYAFAGLVFLFSAEWYVGHPFDPELRVLLVAWGPLMGGLVLLALVALFLSRWLAVLRWAASSYLFGQNLSVQELKTLLDLNEECGVHFDSEGKFTPTKDGSRWQRSRSDPDGPAPSTGSARSP